METITHIETGGVSRQIADATARENIQTLKGAVGTPTVTQTLAAGQTTITFTAQKLNDNSSINVYASIPGLEYTSITVSGNNITITFDEQEEDVYITVIISDVMV